jgi:hypothetical protein
MELSGAAVGIGARGAEATFTMANAGREVGKNRGRNRDF